WIFSFCTEQTIYPSIFMARQTHVIHIYIWGIGFIDQQRIVIKLELVDPIRAFGQCKEGLSVGTLYSGCHYIFAVKFYCSRIENCIDTKPFHQKWIGALVQVIPPEHTRMSSC